MFRFYKVRRFYSLYLVYKVLLRYTRNKKSFIPSKVTNTNKNISENKCNIVSGTQINKAFIISGQKNDSYKFREGVRSELEEGVRKESSDSR